MQNSPISCAHLKQGLFTFLLTKVPVSKIIPSFTVLLKPKLGIDRAKTKMGKFLIKVTTKQNKQKKIKNQCLSM